MSIERDYYRDKHTKYNIFYIIYIYVYVMVNLLYLNICNVLFGVSQKDEKDKCKEPK